MIKSTKFKKLALSSFGDIVDRITGKLIRAKNLMIKSNRVYKLDKKSGSYRLFGYLGKQTKSQKSETERLAENRQKRKATAENKKLKEAAKAAELERQKSIEREKERSRLKPVSEIPSTEIPPLDRMTQEEMNILRALDNRVRDGKLMQSTADDIFDRWKAANTDKERNEIWKEVKKNDPERGYDPSDFDELLYYVQTEPTEPRFLWGFNE